MTKDAMLLVSEQIQIPKMEFQWTFVRAGGPGGQNVNKVASKAVLRWDLARSRSLPADVKARLRVQQQGRISREGELILSSQRFRDQGRNIDDCLRRLRIMILQAAIPPKKRKPTRPSRASRQARLEAKRRRSATKKGRRQPAAEE